MRIAVAHFNSGPTGGGHRVCWAKPSGARAQAYMKKARTATCALVQPRNEAQQ